MQQQEPVNTPLLAGWAIACGAGAVAFGAALVGAGIEGNGSVAIGIVVALVVGVILGLPRRELPPPNALTAPAASGSAAPKASAPSAPASTPAATPVTTATATPVSAPVAGAAAPEATGTRPPVLQAARDGKPDDLKKIKGVGPKLEGLLNAQGIYHFDQIAAWNEDELAWIDSHLEGFYGRASRDEWVPQARILVGGGETEFSSRQE